MHQWIVDVRVFAKFGMRIAYNMHSKMILTSPGSDTSMELSKVYESRILELLLKTKATESIRLPLSTQKTEYHVLVLQTLLVDLKDIYWQGNGHVE
uniref:AlNc14C63G4542 protein n=1 Tax=Albugo laibachii Nc14 TaxID=890382 RepID=F0WD19_9STRA|nr:AlNc14C63G4542 [Albugo laibachii Nc14]|eukprot:CCA19091.1 AlNc14C63G4542 [Albugo laibachii Nc14]